MGYTYPASGVGSVHPHGVRQVNGSGGSTKTVTVRAKGVYYSGWPQMKLYVNGTSRCQWTVSSSSYTNYSCNTLLSGDDVVEVVYTNDVGSRALWVDYVVVDGVTVQAEGGAAVVDWGSENAAFDGLNVVVGQKLLSEDGALRLVKGAKAMALGYDPNGNMTSRVVEGLGYVAAYDTENRLVEVRKSGGLVASFVYDGDGKRVRGDVGGVATVYIGDYYEWTGSVGTMKSYYAAGGVRVAMRVGNQSGTVYYLLTDHLGSTAVGANASGAKVGEVRYKAWGEERPACGSPPCGTIPTTYRYTGQRWESGIGLYFYNARWYDPALGRFVQPDTVVPEPGDPQTLNRFAYVRNNPLRYNDSSGHVLEGGTTSDDPYLQSIPKPPSERYYRTKNYGWFDRSHLKTGRPAQIIQDVNSRIAEGGGIVSVEQPIGMGILSSTFRGNYMISGKASKDQAIGIALGIYMDWSIRFEAWEGSFPGPIGDDTSFAIEDLPSHYVGFYAAATGVPPTTVFWNHLGGIEGTNQAPPRGVKNGEFMPKVQAGGGWTHIPWPEAMTITPVPMGPNTWWPINVGCYSFCWGSSPPNAKDVNTLKPR